MNSFAKFKEIVGYTSQEIMKLTGYSRQGLYHAFEMINKGKSPTNQFKNLISAVINKKIQEETEKHEARVNKLRELQESIGGASWKLD